MTLRDAVALAQQHEEARMALVVARRPEHGSGHFSTGTIHPHSMGDGGFMAVGPSWEHRPGGALYVAWDAVISWSLRLDAQGVS
jgi:hypothetical protein